MAKSNRDRISEVLDALKDGLGPFVLREYKFIFKGGAYLARLSENVATGGFPAPDLPNEASALGQLDVQGWLNAIDRGWNDVFRNKLSKDHRGYGIELSKHRNDWAHQKAFSNEDAHRAADTATRLLEAVGATKQAQITRALSQELLRLRYEAEQKQSVKKVDFNEAPTTTTPGLKPWRFVVEPHRDVREGRYLLSDFVANIADVKAGTAAPEYGNPQEFFRRTYLTEGLVSLLATGVRRLTGQGGDPVVQLQTAFGGGKTHSMLALYHLVGGGIGISQIPGGEHILNLVGEIDDRISARWAVIVGTAFDANVPRAYPDATTHTLWGDIAYQLGGVDGYKMVERADLAAVAPGSDTLVQLLEAYGPALIIIDELVAFARNLPVNDDRVPAGGFDSTMTFFQSLTEAVKRSSDSMLVVSIPESENEIGGERGKAALEILSKTIGRMESVWKPVTANEGFEIVRRRLFTSEIDYAARDAVVSAFCALYRNNGGEFPREASEGAYVQRMTSAYPIHPELFDRLYQDWATLDNFQKTRGVLRMMATVIHKLWQDNDQSLLIMPATIPLWAANVRTEMLRYFPDTWAPVVDGDIDGEASKTYALDKSVNTLGQYTASRRVARSVFVGSAPSVTGQKVRGVEEVRIRLATVQPGEPLAVFGDALRRMSNSLTYLYTDGSRYWYDTRPTVNRIAEDRAQMLSADAVYQEAVTRLRADRETWKKVGFAAAHVAPQDTGDVGDEWRTRIVVLGPDHRHKKGNGTSQAQAQAQATLEKRGNAPRLYRNMLVFVAADASDYEAWDRALREYLAWKSIDDEKDPLNLDAQQRRQVATSLKRAEENVALRLQEAYSWLIVPVQADPTGPVDLEAHRINGQDSVYERAWRKLRSSGWVIPNWSPDNLRIELDQYLWRDQPHVGLKPLWEYFARYCYLPRLTNEEVLKEAVRDGVARDDAPFAYATMASADGTYKGLVYRKPLAKLYFEDDVLVRPEIAEQQLAAAAEPLPQPPVTPPPSGPTGTTGGVRSEGTSPEQPRVARRYHGTVALNPQRANREMATLVEEIIQRLTSLVGTTVDITVEISAERTAGFDEATVRTISENSRTLKFKSHEFEGE